MPATEEIYTYVLFSSLAIVNQRYRVFFILGAGTGEAFSVYLARLDRPSHYRRPRVVLHVVLHVPDLRPAKSRLISYGIIRKSAPDIPKERPGRSHHIQIQQWQPPDSNVNKTDYLVRNNGTMNNRPENKRSKDVRNSDAKH